MNAPRNDDQAGQIDTSVPHSARIWNYWLGGKDNYPIDRTVGDQVMQIFPGIVQAATVSRMFLGRAVQYLAGEAGLRQFLDIGTGLPTVDNTHEVAQRVAPDARIMYVDNDPLVLTHARGLLTSTPEGATWYIDADLYEPGKILAQARKRLDFTQPIALILLGILGHIDPYERARETVAQLMAALPSGSYLVLQDGVDTDKASVESMDLYAKSGAIPYRLRSPEQVAGFFDGLEPVEPGIVSPSKWRPEVVENPWDREEEVPGLAGVARKP